MQDNKIRLVIITTGEDLEKEFNINQPLQAVKAQAMQGLPPGSNPNQFVLEYNGQPLDDSKKIAEYIEEFGWEDGTVLDLVPRPEVI